MTSWQIVRLVAGIFILFSLALGIPGSPLFVSQWWLAFTAFVGANLLQSALTRWCLMESIVRKLGAREGRRVRRNEGSTMRSHLIVVATVLAFFASDAGAMDLLDVWRAALQHDLEFSAADAAHQAGEARRDQGASLWRPTVQFTGTAGRMSSESESHRRPSSQRPASRKPTASVSTPR